MVRSTRGGIGYLGLNLLHPTQHVDLRQSVNLPKPQFLHVYKRDIDNTHLMKWVELKPDV